MAGTQPVKKFHVGSVDVSVWKNERSTEEGPRAFLSVTLQKGFKDKEGQWQHTGSLNPNDLPKAILGLQKAYEYAALGE